MLVYVVREPGARITIIVDIEAETNIARMNLLAATMRKKIKKTFWRSKIRRTISIEL
jgi:hypothetical protein